MKTSVDAKLAHVEPGTLRHQVLDCARRFKGSWVELGALLVKVQDRGHWKEWGHPSFEAYCVKELHIRRTTALKLVHSYGFLSRHERGFTAAPSSAQAPAFEVISVLADAEERGKLSDDDYRAVRDDIWAPGRPAHAVARELRERFPPPEPPSPPAAEAVKRLSRDARRLAEGLRACEQVPRAVADRAAALADDVEDLTSEV